MPQKRKSYAPRLDKDPNARTLIAILRMAGCSSQHIADLTDRHERTIIKELRRPEHKKIFNSFVFWISKEKLPTEVRAVIKKAIEDLSHK